MHKSWWRSLNEGDLDHYLKWYRKLCFDRPCSFETVQLVLHLLRALEDKRAELSSNSLPPQNK